MSKYRRKSSNAIHLSVVKFLIIKIKCKERGVVRIVLHRMQAETKEKLEPSHGIIGRRSVTLMVFLRNEKGCNLVEKFPKCSFVENYSSLRSRRAGSGPPVTCVESGEVVGVLL
ncbi:hypothetical protein TNIN_87471 [Trichonephila inaurata madagascariensis]|uniref:Uncharacterized protein n=1 Tax=Trichonephila inaurata madagascariensis TaxID=2747483 RepID=A0A8X7CGV3_9ARAC|nr:hypothetical protein TNIN_87471 [Trichonephila inaurata madagascariensis]